jgi:MFS family permease
MQGQKTRTSLSGRWFAIFVFFGFMLVHQIDKLLIGPLTGDIMTTFNITYTQMGAVTTGALIIGVIMYPIWGWAYDKFSRAKLLSLASAIWGVTTWLGAIAPTYPLVVGARASTGIDDSSYPGLYSLVADYFRPEVRGKIYGLLGLTSPIGYLIGMVMALMLSGVIGWRAVFYITGSLGLVIAVLMFFGLKEAPRGQAEPEMAGMEQITVHKFEWNKVGGLFKKPTMILIFLQGFFGVFPWNVITYWFFVYLERERGYSSDTILFTMAPAVLIMAAGYPLGGFLGDWLFKKTRRGRNMVSAVGVIMGAVLLYAAMQVPLEKTSLFLGLLCAGSLFMPFASSNVLSTIYDITLPEIRSTANAVESFIENIGATLAPLVAGIIADKFSLSSAIVILCTGTWILCFFFFMGVIYYIPKDIEKLRRQMRERVATEEGKIIAEA